MDCIKKGIPVEPPALGSIIGRPPAMDGMGDVMVGVAGAGVVIFGEDAFWLPVAAVRGYR
jgi:hypothetical protein